MHADGAGRTVFRVGLLALALLGGMSSTASANIFIQQGPMLSRGSGKVALSADGNTALIYGWVFTRSGSTWTEGPQLVPSDPTGTGLDSVALSADGNTALLGANAFTGDTGAAWVFTRSGSTWTQQGPRLAPDNGHVAGVALSADGNTALLGWSGDNQSPTPIGPWGVGAAWVFTRSGSTWTQQSGKLTANDETGDGAFGSSLALSADGNTALIGGPVDTPDPNSPVINEQQGKGAAWVFTRSGSTWTQQGGKLTANDEIGAGGVGTSVALSADGNTALVGGPRHDSEGGAWVFTRSGSSWTQQGSSLAAGGGPFSGLFGGGFGNSVGLSANGATALIGGGTNAWAFTRSGPTWAQQPGPRLRGTGGSGGSVGGVALSGDGGTALLGGAIPLFRSDSTPAAWFFVPTASDPFGDWFALYSPDVQQASCTSDQVIASLTVPYSAGHPPRYTSGFFWVDYYGIPFAISPAFTLPERGLSARGGEIPLSFAAAGLPTGQYNVHFLLWNASGQSGTLSDRTTYWGPPSWPRNPDCSPKASPFAAARAGSVSGAPRKPPHRRIVARLRTAPRNAHLIRVPHAMRSTKGHLRAPRKVLRQVARLRARVAAARGFTKP